MFAFLDTPFDPEFPVYTRANAGEILPEPICPLAWSVVGPGFEESFRIAFCDDLGLIPRPGADRPFQMVGRMAARMHLNLSVLRTAGQRLPGSSADVIDVQYLGDPSTSGLPAYEPRGDDRRFRLKAPPTLGRTLAGIGRRVERDRQAVEALTDEVVATLGAGATDADVVRLLRRTSALFGRVVGTHVTARGLTSPLLEQAVHALARGGVAPQDCLRYVAEIPDLESSKPTRALAELARTIPPASSLADLVAAGSYEALAASDAPGAAELRRRLDELLAQYGHRGPREFDPTVPTWRERPDDVLGLLSRIGGDAPPAPEPPTVDPGRLARPLVAAARSAIARAERTKDTCMRCTDLLRRLLGDLEGRLADRIPPERYLCCTVDELERIACGGGAPHPAELDRRHEDFRAACATQPAEWSDGALRLADGPGEIPDGDLVGIAGSPGVATGRVRIVRDPFDDLAPGEVLVATMTDTSWTPLFLAAGAVITDVGGLLSHATIVARDLGVPAVVNAKHATTALHDGDLVRVDGGTGRIEVLERADR